MTPFLYLHYLIKYRCNPLHLVFFNGRKVLDVGCGEGEFLAKDQAHRVGVDIDCALVRRCKALGLDAHCMSATELGFSDEAFDAVHCAELIEHLDPQTAVQFLAEAARVLKPGGIVYLTTPGEHYVWNTFSHVKPYPPIAFEKLLCKNTEGFIRDKSLPLRLERFFSFGAGSRSRVVTGLKRALNIAFPSSSPSGYVIILRKACDGPRKE